MGIEFFIAILLIVIIPLIIACVGGFKEHIWVHLKTNNKYKVISLGKLKNPTTKEWSEAVFYTSLIDGKTYARDIKDFTVHFTEYRKWKKKD